MRNGVRTIAISPALIFLSLASCVAPAPVSGSTPASNLDTRAFQCLEAGVQYDRNPAVRVGAIEALESAPRDHALPWIRSALHDENPAVRFAAAIAAGNARDPLSEVSIRQLLRDENTSVRIAALYAMHRLGNTEGTGKLATHLLVSDDPLARRNAALVLGMLGEKGAIPILARAVKDDHEPGVRQHALEALARLGNNEAKQELVFSTNSGVGSDEVMAINALAATGDPKFIDTYRYKLATAPHIETQLAAARALGSLGYADGFDLAMSALRHDPPTRPNPDEAPGSQSLRIKQLAAAALGAIGKREALDLLDREMEQGDDPRLQVALARAILDIAAKTDRSLDSPAPWTKGGEK